MRKILDNHKKGSFESIDFNEIGIIIGILIIKFMIKIDKIVISLFLLALTVSFSIEENIEKISNLKTP